MISKTQEQDKPSDASARVNAAECVAFAIISPTALLLGGAPMIAALSDQVGAVVVIVVTTLLFVWSVRIGRRAPMGCIMWLAAAFAIAWVGIVLIGCAICWNSLPS